METIIVTVLPDAVLSGKFDVRPTSNRAAPLRLWDPSGRVLAMDGLPGAPQEAGWSPTGSATTSTPR